MIEPLKRLDPGMPIVFGGDRLTRVPVELAEAFSPGDRLVVVQDDGTLLHIPAAEWEIAGEAVGVAHRAFASMGTVGDGQLEAFFRSFAAHLEDDDSFARIAEANAADVEDATSRGRSTTRLVLTERMRAGMVEGLRLWAKMDTGRGRVVEQIDHDGWSLHQIRSGLGVVGFVFEGRPNVFADATGVLASGNTVVLSSGSAPMRWVRRGPSWITPSLRPSTSRGYRRARSLWSTARAMPPAGRCSPMTGWPWQWRGGPAQPLPSWARWHGSREFPSASTGPVEPGSSRRRMPTRRRSGWRSITPWTAKSATH